MISMPVLETAGSRVCPSPLARSWMPKALGMEGPVMSASRIPARRPRRCMVTAIWLVTMDLPTPPLPDTMPNTLPTWLSGWACLSRDCGSSRSPQLSPQVEQSWVHSLISKLLLPYQNLSSHGKWSILKGILYLLCAVRQPLDGNFRISVKKRGLPAVAGKQEDLPPLRFFL